MCLAIPSRVISVDRERNVALLNTMGVEREASLDLMQEEVEIGEYVLLHIGYVMSKIDAESAKLSLETYEEILRAMREEDEELEEANRDG